MFNLSIADSDVPDLEGAVKHALSKQFLNIFCAPHFDSYSTKNSLYTQIFHNGKMSNKIFCRVVKS